MSLNEFLSCKPGVFISCYLVYFPGVLAGLPFGKLTGERVGFVSVVGLQFSEFESAKIVTGTFFFDGF